MKLCNTLEYKKIFCYAKKFVVILASVPLLTTLTASAMTNISQGYRSAEQLPIGMIVSVIESNNLEVKRATQEDSERIAGVVIDDASVVSIRPEGSNTKVQSSGSAKILATTLNGNVNSGDSLIVSPISGIAMSSGSNMKQTDRIVAIAEESLTENSDNIKRIDIKTVDGSSKQTVVGLVSARIVINEKQNSATTNQSNLITDFASRAAGKSVSVARIMASGVVFAGTIIVTGMLLQGSIRGTFISLGRNPLSRESLLPALAKVSALAMFVFSAGMLAAYFILAV